MKRNIFNDYEFAEGATVQASTSSSSQSFIVPSEISPIPHLQKCSFQTKTADISRHGSATLITGSPHKYKITENTERKKLNVENRATKRNITSRKGSTSSSSSSNGDEEIGLILVSTDEEDHENEAPCSYYRHFFSENKRGEKWARCTKCCEGCHEECAGEREDWAQLTCTECPERLERFMIFLSNCSFQSSNICYYFDIFSIPTILFFLCYEVPLIFPFLLHFHIITMKRI
jgi:hypothetical protein